MDKGGALDGVRVLDLSRRLPGGYCTAILSDMGADVIKVEDIGRGDDARYEPPFLGKDSYYHLTVNRGKRSVAVDLKSYEGQNVLHKLVRSADVMVESFRPGVVQRLGADYATVSRVNSQIVYCSLSGYGQSGPYAERSGHDINYMAQAGVLSLLGVDSFCVPGLPLGDIVGSLWAVNAIVSALYGRTHTGEGQLIDLSITDVLIAMLTIVAGRYFVDGNAWGNPELRGQKPSYTAYPASDGLIVVGAWENRFWERFCRMIGRPDLTEDLGNEDQWGAVRAEIAEITQTRTRNDWERLNREYDACVSGARNVGEAVSDDYVSARSLLGDVLTTEGGLFPFTKPPTSGTGRPSARPPGLGEHTAELLNELGLTSDEIHDLSARDVIRVPSSRGAGNDSYTG